MKFKHWMAVLVLSLSALLLSACGEQKMTKATDEELTTALQEVAMAYYYKNPYTQYEQNSITEEGKNFAQRSSWDMSPQVAEQDYYHYTVCSTFVASVYKIAFDYEFPETDGFPLSTIDYKTLQGDGVVFRALGGDGVDYAANAETIRALLQPGDIIVAHDGANGHAMLYLGDIYGDGVNYVIHCWGSHATDTTDKIESSGAIKLQTEDELLFGPKVGSNPNYRIDEETHCKNFVCIFRPFANEDFKKEITEEAVIRMKYSGISVDKYLDITQYNSVTTGDEITLNLKIQNNGTEDFTNIPIKEFNVSGLTLKRGTEWKKMTVKAGDIVLMSLTYEVTAKAGETVTFKAGSVGGLETREISVSVAQSALSSKEIAALKETAQAIVDGTVSYGTDLNAVNEIYKQVCQKELNLPETVFDYISLCYKKQQPLGYDIKGLVVADETEANAKLLAMQPKKLYGGKYRLAQYEGLEARVWEFLPDYFDVGDIIISIGGISTTTVSLQSDLQIMIYLGGDSVLILSNGTASMDQSFKTELNKLICQNQVFTLRPGLVY